MLNLFLAACGTYRQIVLTSFVVTDAPAHVIFLFEMEHLGPNYLATMEVYENTNFEAIQSLFNLTQKLILEHSEEILKVHTIESASPSWIVS